MTATPTPRRRAAVRRVVAASGLLTFVVALLLTGAGVASAHAVLQSTEPAGGAVVQHAPRRVLLHFGEGVTVPPHAIAVYDRLLHHVERGPAGHLTGEPDVVGVRLSPHLSAGTYTVTYRVISADSHPVSGGFRFSVGHPSPAATPAAPAPGGAGTALMAAARWVGYAGAVLAIGGVVVLLGLWTPGRRDRRARALAWCGWGLLAVGALGQLLVEGPYGVGAPLTRVADPALLAETVSTRFGHAILVRLTLLVLLAGWLADVFDRRSVTSGRLSCVAGSVLGVGVLLTMSLSGHAATGDLVPLSVAADLVHLVAMALWLGGLALLSACLLARSRAAELAAALPGFSRLAMLCVTALVVTGGYQAWRNVRYLPAFLDTTYGLLLVAKMAVFLLLLALGDLARRRVGRHYRSPRGTPGAGGVHALRRGLAAEAGIGAAVLALTAVLVGTAQASEAYSPTYRTRVTARGTHLLVVASPAHVGPTTLTVRLRDRAGAPVSVDRVSGSLTLPDRHVGPLPVTFHTGTNTATAHARFPEAGGWLLDIAVRTSPTSATTYRIRIPVIE